MNASTRMALYARRQRGPFVCRRDIPGVILRRVGSFEKTKFYPEWLCRSASTSQSQGMRVPALRGLRKPSFCQG